jgi:hypothetical protein
VSVLENGNVGIGTTNPTQKLEIKGNIATSGSGLITGPLVVNSGASVFKIMTGSTSPWGPTVLGGTGPSLSFLVPVTGARQGDVALATHRGITQAQANSLVMTALVVANDTVMVTLKNIGVNNPSSSITVSSNTLVAAVLDLTP